jgi:hypothetical protein
MFTSTTQRSGQSITPNSKPIENYYKQRKQQYRENATKYKQEITTKQRKNRSHASRSHTLKDALEARCGGDHRKRLGSGRRAAKQAMRKSAELKKSKNT